MIDKPLSEMRAWLWEIRRGLMYSWNMVEADIKNKPFKRNCGPEWRSVRNKIIIIDSILAALSGPSEEERRRLAIQLEVHYLVQLRLDMADWEKAEVKQAFEDLEKIRLLILGHAAQEGEKTNQQIIAEDRMDTAAAGARGIDELMREDGRRSVSATDRTRKPDWCDEHASPEKIKNE